MGPGDWTDYVMGMVFLPEGTEEALSYLGNAINEEAGEIAGEIKRIARDDGGKLTLTRRERLYSEIGDVLYYVEALMGVLCVDPDLIRIRHKWETDAKKAASK